jgi:acetylornithine/succinyldiaminopimelate/putrescine aminotransferase
MIEPIQEAGVICLDGYLREVREICNKNNVPFIVDVQTGPRTDWAQGLPVTMSVRPGCVVIEKRWRRIPSCPAVLADAEILGFAR